MFPKESFPIIVQYYLFTIAALLDFLIIYYN